MPDAFNLYLDRLSHANEVLERLFDSDVFTFKQLVPSVLPPTAGVYAIFDTTDDMCLYVGRTKNLRNRLYTNHLMGSTTNARLKKYLIEDSTLTDIDDKMKAKQFIRERCYFRFIEVSGTVERGQIEGLLSYLLNVRYIHEEH